MIAATTGNASDAFRVVFSSVGLFVALVVALVIGIVLFRARHRPGSRMRAVIDAGALAIPGVVTLVAGVVGLVVGIAYLLILFIYWLFYFIVASIWVSLVGGTVTYPAEFAQIAGQGFIYIGLGVLVAAVGALWLALVIVRAVRVAHQRLLGATYTVEPPSPPTARLDPGEQLKPADRLPPGPAANRGGASATKR